MLLAREPEAQAKPGEARGLFASVAGAAAGVGTRFRIFGRPRTKPILVAPVQAATGSTAGMEPEADPEVGDHPLVLHNAMAVSPVLQQEMGKALAHAPQVLHMLDHYVLPCWNAAK